MQNVIMAVSKKSEVTKKYEKVGEVAITVPLLSDIAAIVAGAKEKERDEEGLPVYEADEANFVQSAILAYVKMNARNKLIPGTATVKDGLKIPTNWEELCAEGTRGGNGAALALAREVKEEFAKWANTLGKSAAAVKVLTDYFSNKTALALANADHKGKMKAYIEQFSESLSEEQLERYERPLTSILEVASSNEAGAQDF